MLADLGEEMYSWNEGIQSLQKWFSCLLKIALTLSQSLLKKLSEYFAVNEQILLLFHQSSAAWYPVRSIRAVIL